MELELEQIQLSGYEMVLETTVFQEETLETIVPDACPDILRIVDTEGCAFLSGREATEGRAGFSGQVEAAVLYQPDGEEGIRRMTVTIPFSGSADGSRIDSRCRILAVPRVEGMETRILNPRKVLLRAGIAVELQVYAPMEDELCSGAADSGDGSVQQLCETCRSYHIACVQEKPFSVSDDVMLPGSKPEAETLLKHRLGLACGEAKTIGNRLIFKGNATLQLLYQSRDGMLCDGLFELPFSQIMEVSNSGEEPDASVEVTAVRCAVSLEDSGDGRTIHVGLELLAQAVLFTEQSFPMLTDMYSVSYALETETRAQTLDHLIERSSKAPALREVIESGELAEEVVDAYLSVGRLEQHREEGRLVLEAEIRATALCRMGSGSLETVSKVFQVPCTLDLPEGCRCICDCRCPEPLFAAPTTGGVEVRFAVEFRYLALQSVTVIGISAARLDMDTPRAQEGQPSIILRMVGKGERLWDIAKACGTTMADIRQANALEEDCLPDGQLLLIPRKRA